MTKIERDHGQSLQTAYEYTYTGDGIRHMKKDHLSEKEYRYGCSIDCGGMPLRVYSRELGSQGEWNSVEDYLQVGTALGYGQHWQFEHSGGELLMMGASGEPREYYPQDSNGLNVQSEPSAPCVCVVQPQTPAVCAPLGYGGCEGGRCEETPPVALGFPCLGKIDKDIDKCLKKCRGKKGKAFIECMAICLGKEKGRKYCEENYCKYLPDAAECVKGNPCKISNPDVTDCQHCCDIKYYCCLIFNPPGTPGARKCYEKSRDCYLDCDFKTLFIGGDL